MGHRQGLGQVLTCTGGGDGHSLTSALMLTQLMINKLTSSASDPCCSVVFSALAGWRKELGAYSPLASWSMALMVSL